MNDVADPKPQTKTSSDVGPVMYVKVYSPYKVYFEQDDCQSISAVNDSGPFDILPHHHNFMTLLSSGELVIQTAAGEQRIHISRGIMHVKANRVVVFLDV
jgi:F0F1-type ATP synthase epsilon subunit